MVAKNQTDYTELKDRVLELIDRGLRWKDEIYSDMAILLSRHTNTRVHGGWKNPNKLLEQLFQDLRQAGIIQHNRQIGWHRVEGEDGPSKSE